MFHFALALNRNAGVWTKVSRVGLLLSLVFHIAFFTYALVKGQ